MFLIEMQSLPASYWFIIWRSGDGADTAKYLKDATENEKRPGVSYRMRWDADENEHKNDRYTSNTGTKEV